MQTQIRPLMRTSLEDVTGRLAGRGQPIEVVRRIRYDILHHVAELLEMLPGGALR